MNKKNNQRTLNTLNKIKEVLLGKLGEKDINQISVREICRDANINRTTFYAHYDDIYDLMQNIELEMEQGIRELFLDPERGTYKVLTEKSLEKLLTYVSENANFYRVYLNNFNHIKSFDSNIAASWRQEIEPVRKKRTNVTETELRYQFEYFNSGFQGVVRKWLNTNCQESPPELIRVLKTCIDL